jgi:hypothetical protein
MQNSTSSTPTEKSKRLDEVIALGRRLIEELGLAHSADILSKWMAHYLAELIFDAENATDPNARKSAQEKCCETISRLWDHRASFPRSARPLANLELVLDAIRQLLGNQEPWVGLAKHLSEETDDPWCEFIKNAYCADRRMAYIAVLTAIAENSFGREKRWLDENKEMLSEEEAEIISTLDEWLNSKRDWFTTNKKLSVGELSPVERTQFILNELEVLVSKQQEALKHLKERSNAGK